MTPAPCASCTGACCKKGFTGNEFAVCLLEGPEFFKEAAVEHEPGKWVIPFGSDRACIFLRDDRCSIHENRPLACRIFNCLIFLQVEENR